MRARPLGTSGSQGITGKTPITARRHPVPALATWKRRKKKGSACLFCRKCSKWGIWGQEGCHVTCFLNLGCVCVCARGYSAYMQVWECPSLAIRDFGKSLCARDSGEGREDPDSTTVCAFSRLASFQPLEPDMAPASGVWVWSLWSLANGQLIWSKMGCHAGGGTSRGWFRLNLSVKNYRLSVMLYFLPQRLEYNRRNKREKDSLAIYKETPPSSLHSQ